MLLHKCSSLLDCQFSDKGSETYFKIQAPLVPVIIICKMKRRAAPLGNRGGGGYKALETSFEGIPPLFAL